MKAFYLLIFMSLSCIASAQKKTTYNYEISCVGNAVGYYVVEVSAYVSKKKDIGEDIVKQCALHGVLFKGFSSKIGWGAQKPIIEEILNDEKKKITENLISVDYNEYTESIGVALKVVKIHKKYKITTTIQVAKDLLRKELEKEGIIRKLGF